MTKIAKKCEVNGSYQKYFVSFKRSFILSAQSFGGRFLGKDNQKEVLFDKGINFRFERMQIEDGCPVFYLTEI